MVTVRKQVFLAYLLPCHDAPGEQSNGSELTAGLGAARHVKLENKVKAAEWEPSEQWVGELESREPTQHSRERVCWVMGELIK